MRLLAIFLFSGLLYSCQSVKQEMRRAIASDTSYSEDLFWGPIDSIVRKTDTTTIYNSRMDTVITEVGIFSYLCHDYRITASLPDSVYYPVKMAIHYKALDNHTRAKKYHKIVLDYYQRHWPTSTHGYMWSDLGAVYAHKVNTSILISYSLEELGLLDESIVVLKPYLANYETWGTKIHQRFIEQCIKKYGIEHVRKEVSTCPSTLKLQKGNATTLDKWMVTVYGADIRLTKTWLGDRFTVQQADSLLKLMDFYKVLK